MKLIFKIVLFSVLFSTLLISCDPAHDISFINNTNSDIKIKLNLIPDTENYNLNEISTNDSIVFNLKEKDTASMYFGMGGWSENEINGLTNCINSIEIKTKKGNKIYKSKNSIFELLNDNTSGIWKTEINIKIND